jgi:hypothetical protein
MKTKNFISMSALVLIGIIVCLIACNNDNGNEIKTKELTGTITITHDTYAYTYTLLTANYNGSEAVSYQWNKDETAINDVTGKTYTPTESGIYTVTVSASGYNSKTSAPVEVEDFRISFENYTSPSVLIENLTGERLVAFKDTLSFNTLISGFPAYAVNHGLEKDPNLFNASCVFTILIITESQFNQNKGNLNSLNNQAFGRLFAFYNHSTVNKNNIQISDKLGGNGRLTVNNTTSFNVELHIGGSAGENIGFSPAQTSNGTVICLKSPDNYAVYPVFKLYKPSDNEIYTAVPVYKSGLSENKPFSVNFSFTADDTNKTFNVSEIESADYRLSSVGVFLKIINNSAIDICLFRNNEIQNTSLGIDIVKSHKDETYFIRAVRNPDGTIPEYSSNITPLFVGTAQNKTKIDDQTYDIDYLYEIEVTGNSISGLQLGAVTKKNKVNLEQIFGINP